MYVTRHLKIKINIIITSDNFDPIHIGLLKFNNSLYATAVQNNLVNPCISLRGKCRPNINLYIVCEYKIFRLQKNEGKAQN